MRNPRPFKQYLKSYRELGYLGVDQEISKAVLEIESKVEAVYSDISHLPVRCILQKYKDTLDALSKNTKKPLYNIMGNYHSIQVPYDIKNPIDNDRAALLMAVSYVILSDYVAYVDTMLKGPKKTPSESMLVNMKKYL